MGRRASLIGGAVLLVLSLLSGVTLLVAGEDGGGELSATDAGSASTTTGPTSTSAPHDPRHGSTSLVSVPTTAAPETSTTIPVLRRFTVAATGDFLIHDAVIHQARADGGGATHDFTPMLAEVAPLLREADLAVCHLEVPLSPDNSDVAGYPVFSAPHELAPAIAWAGYDTCSTASNHSLDRGLGGLSATLDHLDAAGMAHAGTARTAEEAAAPTLLDAGGVTVAHLAYTYGLGGALLPAEAPWSVNLLEAERVLGDAAQARSAGAEFVVVSMHAGIEYQRSPSAEQTALADRLLASDDIDLIIGHHVHVIQPVDRIHGKIVAYGLGNFLSNQSPDAGLLPSTQDGMILRVTVEEGPAGRFSATGVTYTPTFVDRAGGHVVRPVDDSSNPASYQRTVEAVGALGVEGVVPDR